MVASAAVSVHRGRLTIERRVLALADAVDSRDIGRSPAPTIRIGRHQPDRVSRPASSEPSLFSCLLAIANFRRPGGGRRGEASFARKMGVSYPNAKSETVE